MPRARHYKKAKNTRHGTAFWDQEYSQAEHLALSTNPSADLEKFTRWLERDTKRTVLNATNSVYDAGCGNGRNLLFLAVSYGMHGVGYDSSSAAIKEAKRLAEGYHLTYEVRTMAGDISLPDESQTLTLDMMSSHFLNVTERTHLRDELHRILKPGGYFFMKTFVSDEDLHTARLLKESPGKEAGTYIHPIIGVAEYVYSEAELTDFLSEKFIVHKVYLSHKHRSKGRGRKRRTISVYAQKDPYT